MTIQEIEQEIAAKKAAKAAQLEAEIARIAAENDERRKAEEAERHKAIEAEDKRREAAYEKELETDARALFFGGNSGASEATYKAVREEYRALVMRRRAEAAASAPQHSLYLWR